MYNGADRDGQNGNPGYLLGDTEKRRPTKCGGLDFLTEDYHG